MSSSGARAARAEYLSNKEFKDLGITELTEGTFLCPAHTCEREYTVSSVFVQHNPHAYKALGLVQHIESGECLYTNQFEERKRKRQRRDGPQRTIEERKEDDEADQWCYVVLVGEYGKKLYVGISTSLLRRWTDEHNGTVMRKLSPEGPKGIVYHWGRLLGCPAVQPDPQLFNISEVTKCVLHVLPGNADTENQIVRKLWFSGIDNPIHRVRGGDLNLLQLSEKQLESISDGYDGRCVTCQQQGHSQEMCPETRAQSKYKVHDVLLNTFGLAKAVRRKTNVTVNNKAQGGITEDGQGASDLDNDQEGEDVEMRDPEEAQFSPQPNKLSMLSALYGLVNVSEDLWHVGYTTVAPAEKSMAPTPGSWLAAFELRCRPLQQEFTTAISKAIAGETTEDTIFFRAIPNSGKTLAQLIAGVNLAIETNEGTLIIAPQRNVAEDLSRSDFLRNYTSAKKTIKISKLLDYDPGTTSYDLEDEDVMIGGDLEIPVGRDIHVIRWCVFLGSRDNADLSELYRDVKWMSEVKVMIGTVDMVYSKFPDVRFIKNLGLILADEVHMLLDEFGVNFRYLLDMLHLSRWINHRRDLVTGLSTATCNDPKSLSCDLTGRDEKRVMILQSSFERKYVSLYSREEEQRRSRLGCRANQPPSATFLFDKLSDPELFPSKGNMVVIYQRKDVKAAERERFVELLDRKNYTAHATAISFHTSKKEISVLLQGANEKGQATEVFSYHGDQAKVARMLRGSTAEGKTMLATSAAHVGQNVRGTSVVLMDVGEDRHADDHTRNRGGRDEPGVVFIRCKDPKDDPISGAALKDPAAYLLGDGHDYRLPLESPSLFYKNAFVFLKRYKLFPRLQSSATASEWKPIFEKMFVPNELKRFRDELVKTSESIDIAMGRLLEKFAESRGVTEVEAEKDAFVARQMAPKVQIVELHDTFKKVVGEVSVENAFQHYFPDSIMPSMYSPKIVWKCVGGQVRRRVDKASQLAVPVQELSKLYVTAEPWSGVVTTGVLEKSDPFDDTCDKNISEITVGAFVFTLRQVTMVLVFDGYRTEGDDNLDIIQPSEITSIPPLGFWKKGSQLRTDALQIGISFPRVGMQSLVREGNMLMSRLIQEHLGLTQKAFMMTDENLPETKGHEIRVTELEKGKACGLCLQMCNPAFTSAWISKVQEHQARIAAEPIATPRKMEPKKRRPR